MSFIKFLKDYWRDLTPKEVCQRELSEATLELLQAESGAEYAQSIITYNQTRIKRLKSRLEEFA